MVDLVQGLGVELGETAQFACPCCGRNSDTVHGFLYTPSGETCVYFGGYTHGHPERRANMLLSSGGWGEGNDSEERIAVGLQALFDGPDPTFLFPPVEKSPWFGQDFLGRMLAPEELVASEKARYRRLALFAIENDPRLDGYRNNG